MSLEDRMNKILIRLGVQGWTACWQPDPSEQKRGQAFPGERVIVVYDEEPDDALETAVHEVLEIQLRGVVQPYREMANALIEAFDRVTYEAKERAIDRLVPFILQTVREVETGE